MKGGLGTASVRLADGTIVGAIVVVNALGDVIDPRTQQVIAGTRHPQGTGFMATSPFGNTTIAVIATNAAFTKEEINKVAQMAHNGLAQVIRPAHTMFDGDTIFALAIPRTGEQNPPAAIQVSQVGNAAAITLAHAILKAVRTATTLHGVPAASDLSGQ
jgi:L-aminopeptidase/D-esterase-like protein